MTNTREQLSNMYAGLVCIHWAKDNTKMGTAKQKALMQMQSFSKTVDAKNPVARTIRSEINEMTKSVSKQIMTNKSSEMVLDKKQAAQYKSFGERQVADSKKALNNMIANANKSMGLEVSRDWIEKSRELSKKQDMASKKNAPQYRALNTNVAAKAPKNVQQIDQQKLLQIMMMQKKLENVG